MKTRKEKTVELLEQCVTGLLYERAALEELCCTSTKEEQTNERSVEIAACADAISALRSLIQLIEQD